MKNTHIQSLKHVVPPTIRLEIYQELIGIYRKQSCPNLYYGFCMAFPILLWGLKSYLDKGPNGIKWSYEDTGIAFPELTADVIKDITVIQRSDSTVDKLRIEYLKTWIKELKESIREAS